MIVEGFAHRHAGHCETGVTAALLTHYGLPLSEPMALGLSGALTFAHLPMIKVGGFPLTAYRMPPGGVYKGLAAPLSLRMERRRYRDAAASMADLDRALAAGRIVGLQTSVFWLPYFPADMRFHFNAHNLIVYGRDGDDYLVSDPVFEHAQRCPSADLAKARFARGIFAPRGLMYFPLRFDAAFDLERAVRRAVKKTWKMMLYTPLPYVGVRAIRRLATSIETLPRNNADARYQRLYVGNIVRMQEEIGTGGGGFRFMYAAFLQEAAHKLDAPLLREAAAQMTRSGDTWREFALAGAHFTRSKNEVDCGVLAARLRACADAEEKVYRLLKSW